MDLNEAKKELTVFIRTRSYDALCVWANAEITKVQSIMEVVSETQDLGKLQGRIKTLRQILQLEKEVATI